VAGAPACAAQGISPGAKLWLFTPQQQATDSVAASTAWAESDAHIGSGQKTAFVRLSGLRCENEGY